MRAMTSFFGVTLMASAVGVWVVSGVGIDMQLVLFKLVLTLVFFISGLSLTLSARRRVHPEVHLDNAKSELRVMERGCDGVARLKAAISYSEIQDVDFRDGMLCATGENGEALLEMPMGMIDNLDHLQAALGQSFNRVA